MANAATSSQTTLQSLTIKTVEQIRDDYLRTYRNGLINRGIASPNVSDGTAIFNKATSLAQQVYAASVAVPLAADAQMPDSAQGPDLVRQAVIYLGGGLRPAGPSAGPLVFTAALPPNVGVAISQGQQLLDPSGLTYEVSVGGTYAAGGPPVPINSVDVGAATKLTAGTVLRWVTPPAFVNPTAAVGVGGLTGGADPETYDGLRARLMEKLGNPPNGVNWASLVTAIEGATGAVQKGFAYPACNGASTEHGAAVGAPPGTTTPTGRNRDVDALVTLPTVIVPAALADRPQFVETVITTIQNYPVQLCIGLSLPASALSSPQGPGGGWIDADPFPVPDLVAILFCATTVVTSSTSITLQSVSAPVLGGQVSWVSTDDWQLYTAKILSFTVSGGGPLFTYAVVLDSPFVSVNGVTIAVGDYVFPAALNMGTYVAAWLAGFGALGPGEKTSAPGLMPRAMRRPLASQSWPSALLRPFLANFTGAGPEVTDAQYLYKSPIAGAPSPTIITVFGTQYIAPPLPALITDGPYILTPNRVAFYPV